MSFHCPLLSLPIFLVVLVPSYVSSQYGFDPRLNYQQQNYPYNPAQQQQAQQYNYNPSPQQELAPAPAENVRAGFSVRNGSYVLEWEVQGPSITFKASRAGTGFVGFAISPSGGMAGADIFIAGLDQAGMPFANDYHHEYMPGGIGAAVPDRTNNYQVLAVYERGGRTTALFQRLLDTRDVAEDHAIQNSVQNILWSIGPPSRGLEYHGPQNRGVVKINLLNPPPSFRRTAPLS